MAKKKFTIKPRTKKNVVRRPLWKMEDGITFSALSKWQTCPEQFSLQWIDGLTPKAISIPLEFGSVIHYALENQDKSTPHEVIHRITDHYRKYRSSTLVNSSERDTLNYILGLAEIVFPHYCEYWKHDDSKIDWIGREEKFKVPYSFPTVDGSREILLRGMRDGLYNLKDHDEVFGIFETKTKSRIVESEIIANLNYDMQTMIYCFATYLTTGRYPNQVKYNVIRRPDTYRRKGEALDSFLRRVNEDIAKRPDFYFMRYTATILQADIDRFAKQTLNPILNLFAQWWDSVKKNPLQEEIVLPEDRLTRQGTTIEGRWSSPFHFLNSSALVGKFGKAEMWDAIFGNMQPYRVRDQIFPELEESFQVTWD